MNCDFETVELRPGHWQHTCRNCGVVRRGPKPRFIRPCQRPAPIPPRRGACRHRGPELRREECTSCGQKKTQVKVFACAEFGECTIGRRVGELPVCQACKVWRPPSRLIAWIRRLAAAIRALAARLLG